MWVLVNSGVADGATLTRILLAHPRGVHLVFRDFALRRRRTKYSTTRSQPLIPDFIRRALLHMSLVTLIVTVVYLYKSATISHC
jgi:hypothetical protein